jgi:hypothetical protein
MSTKSDCFHSRGTAVKTLPASKFVQRHTPLKHKTIAPHTMCHKLVQTYACSHSKEICTTPCPHALALSSTRTPAGLSSISRSNSVVSSIAPSSRRDAAEDSPVPSMLDVSPLPGVSQQPGLFAQPARSPHAKVSPLTGVSPRLAFRLKIDNRPATGLPGMSTSSRLDAALSDNTEAQPVQSTQPVYCAYYFPHHLMQSRYPCRECYMRPEWEDMRRAWMENYQLGHPMDRSEDLERLAGIRT